LEWENLLTDADVACVKAEDQGMYYFFDVDSHVRENGILTQIEATGLGEFWRYTPVVGFSETAGKAGPAPIKGEHTRPVLKELGYTDGQITDFKERGIVDWDEV